MTILTDNWHNIWCCVDRLMINQLYDHMLSSKFCERSYHDRTMWIFFTTSRLLVWVLRNKIMTDRHLIHVPSSTAVQFFAIFTANDFWFEWISTGYLYHKSTWLRVDLEFRSRNIIFNHQTTTKRYFDRFYDHLSGFDQILFIFTNS